MKKDGIAAVFSFQTAWLELDLVPVVAAEFESADLDDVVLVRVVKIYRTDTLLDREAVIKRPLSVRIHHLVVHGDDNLRGGVILLQTHAAG